MEPASLLLKLFLMQVARLGIDKLMSARFAQIDLLSIPTEIVSPCLIAAELMMIRLVPALAAIEAMTWSLLYQSAKSPSSLNVSSPPTTLALLISVAKSGTGKAKTVLNAHLDGTSTKANALSFLPIADQVMLPLVNAFLAIKDTILLKETVFTHLLTLLLPLMLVARFGSLESALNALITGNSMRIKSVFLYLISAKPTKVNSAQAASMDTS